MNHKLNQNKGKMEGGGLEFEANYMEICGAN